MNPSSLSARTSRSHLGERNPFYVSRDTGGQLTDLSNARAPAEPAARGESDPLAEEVPRLRLALAQMLAHETGQNIQVFRSPAMDTARLCAIADNIWNLRRWSD